MSRVATIFHNAAVDDEGRQLGVFGYQPGQPMALVFRAGLPDSLTGAKALESLFEEFNIGDDRPAGGAYRTVYGLRSLSVGDIVELDGTYYACGSCGWSQQPEPLVAVRSHPRVWPLS
ncbi:MAG: hypothetical protein L0H59_05220 [Tomitella sp.]|nr:hypothetical protein [Tomitella sp.]